MPTPDAINEEITLTGVLELVADAPEVDDGVSDLVDTHFQTTVRANMALTSNGGTKRDVIKPTVKSYGDAPLIDVLDALWAIAWTHCSKAGVKARYCVQLYERDAAGKVKANPVRAYFDLGPDSNAGEEFVDTDKPSSSYVRDLERTNVRSLQMLQNSAGAVLRRDSQYHRDRVEAEAQKGRNEVELARIGIERDDAKASQDRKGKLFDGALNLLPAAGAAALKKLTGEDAGDESDADAKLPPGERVKKFLTEKELAIFIDGIGKERWVKFEASKTIAECREGLAGLGEAEIVAMVKAGLPAEKLTELSTWADAPEETDENKPANKDDESSEVAS